MEIDPATSKDSLLKGFRIHAFQPDSNTVVIETEARYAEAGVAALAEFCIVMPVVLQIAKASTAKPLIGQVVADGNVAAWAMFFAALAIFAILPLMFAVWFWSCCFPRRFVFADGMLRFRGAPGRSLVTSFENIQAVVICTFHRKRDLWDCNVALQIKRGSRVSLLCINSDPVCGPGAYADHRGQVEWLIEAHRPLADLLSSTLNKPVQIEQQVGLLPLRRWFLRFWP
ncbi:MAG: hypothetical protein HQ518_28320 [Rhodopirellula sp.]|nr:hypothetical protein [Rhodopirellula sp.]